MLASSRKPCDAANPKRRAFTPALHCGRKRALTRRRQPTAMPDRGPMRSSAPTQALRADGGMRRPAAPRFCRLFTLHCRAGVHARRGPCGGPEGYWQGKAPHPSVIADAMPPPLAGEAFGRQALDKASPARGCGVERRLRRIQRDGAGAAVAEHKRASARAVRCGHRKPDGGCAARRRRRGALPLCGGDIL